MILDPYGDILAECRSFSDEFVIATISADKLKLAGGYRYIKARRPELTGNYWKTACCRSKVSWLEAEDLQFKTERSGITLKISNFSVSGNSINCQQVSLIDPEPLLLQPR
jgi:hypothetical protein